MIGEFGSKLQTTSDQQWFGAFTSYIKQNSLNWTFWSLNPDSGDTGGLLADDWKTVIQAKQDALKQLQYPFIGSGSGPAPTATPTSGVTGPTPTATAVPSTFLLDGFESGSTSRWTIYHNSAATISKSIVSPGAVGTYAMKVTYSIASGGTGRVQQSFASPRTWRSYTEIAFRFYGASSGNTIRLELMDDRAPGSTTDTSERFEYIFADNFSGWKTFHLPWYKFTRRAWQPSGAPNNGLTLTQMWGYSFAPLKGSGSFRLDQILLSTATVVTPTPAPSTSLLIENFESGSAAWSLFRDSNSNISAQMVSPGEAGYYAMQVTARIASNGWGGVQRLYSAAQNWTAYARIDFWLYGGNTGSPMRLEILDNRAAGSTTDTSERFVYLFTDNWTGWKHMIIPWSSFVRRTDWQPAGAPNDGFGRSQIWGLNFSVISGTGNFKIDEIKLISP